MRRSTRLALLLGTPLTLSAQTLPPPTRIDVAPGVYLFRTTPYSDVGLDGNSVVITSRDGVLVFDANGTPAAAAAVLGEIRKLTDQPVRYLVLSHWHWDHWYGAEVYRKAFPGLTIISHEATKRLMQGPAIEFNRSGIEEQLPGHVAAVEARIKELSAVVPPDTARITRARKHLAEDQFFLAQKKGMTPTVADRTFTDSLTLRLGERRIDVLHYDRAITPGDSFLYLPDEKVLITGDLLVNPLTFALGSYPSGLIRTLERLDALDATVIVPGHGEPLHDKVLLETNLALFKDLLRIGREARGAGKGVEEARAMALTAEHELMVRLTRDDPALNQQFDIYMVDWFLHRVYDELDGRLTDDIAPIPVHP